MRGQRGRLPVQALGYVNSTKAIFGLPKTTGVRFRLSRYMMIRQFRNGDPGEIRFVIYELVFVNGENKVGDIFSQLLGNKMANSDHGNAVPYGHKNIKTFRRDMSRSWLLLLTMHCGVFQMEFTSRWTSTSIMAMTMRFSPHTEGRKLH